MQNSFPENSQIEDISITVLDFYKTMPFNYFDSSKECATIIKNANSVTAYLPTADKILQKGTSLLEVGCGCGWFANSVQYYYNSDVTAIDFNPVAIDFAVNTSQIMDLSSKFIVADWFKFSSEEKYDVVVSFGALHHTSDCLGALEKLCSFVKPGGIVSVGLYHKYGRAPFLEYFDKLKQDGLDKRELFEKYQELDNRHSQNKTNSESWFRDQVMHPHETQHTLKEICNVFAKFGIDLERTSINGFAEFDNVESLFEAEKRQYERGVDMLRQKRYYPGFFIAEGRNTILSV